MDRASYNFHTLFAINWVHDVPNFFKDFAYDISKDDLDSMKRHRVKFRTTDTGLALTLEQIEDYDITLDAHNNSIYTKNGDYINFLPDPLNLEITIKGKCRQNKLSNTAWSAFGWTNTVSRFRRYKVKANKPDPVTNTVTTINKSIVVYKPDDFIFKPHFELKFQFVNGLPKDQDRVINIDINN